MWWLLLSLWGVPRDTSAKQMKTDGAPKVLMGDCVVAGSSGIAAVVAATAALVVGVVTAMWAPIAA